MLVAGFPWSAMGRKSDGRYDRRGLSLLCRQLRRAATAGHRLEVTSSQAAALAGRRASCPRHRAKVVRRLKRQKVLVRACSLLV